MADEIEIKGLKALEEAFLQMPIKIQNRARRKGLTKAANRLRRELRRAAPKRSGYLRQAIQTKVSKRNPIAWVGLRPVKGRAKKNIKKQAWQTPYYYRRLETDYGKRHAFFTRTVEQATPEILEILLNETKAALFQEAGKAHARSLRGR